MKKYAGTVCQNVASFLMLSVVAMHAIAQSPTTPQLPAYPAPGPGQYSVPSYPATAPQPYSPTYPSATPSYPAAPAPTPDRYAMPPQAYGQVAGPYAAPAAAPYASPAAPAYPNANPLPSYDASATAGNPYANLAPANSGAYAPPPTQRMAAAPSVQGDTYPSPSDYAAPSPQSVAPAVVPDESVVEETVIYEDATWYNPGTWFAGPVWDNSVEFGLNGSDGNSETLSIRVGASAKRETEHSKLNLEARYNKASASGIETQNNAIGEIRHDWLLGDSPWSLFANGMIEYDEFRAFDARVAVNGGVGYRIIDTDATTLTGRFGSGVSHEIGGPNDDYVPEAVFGLDYEQQITKRQKIVAKADYFPEWGEFENYRFLTDVGWEILLDEEANLSMKLALTDRYDSTPEGLKPNDISYSMLLLWKL